MIGGIVVIDLPEAKTVDISISPAPDGDRIWIHIDGMLSVRVYRIAELTIEDRRPLLQPEGGDQ